jgi:hypothetical protein
MEESKVTNGQYQAISPGPTRSSPSGVIRFDKFEVLRTGAK